MSGFLSKWIEGRTAIKLKKLEIAEVRRLEKKAEKKARETFALVRQEKESWTNTEHGEGLCIYLMYENSLGERELELEFTLSVFEENRVYLGSDFYICVVKPWLRGQYVKDIDTYEEVQQGILIDKLIGKGAFNRK